MSVIIPSNPREVQDFQFKLVCRLNVFSGQDNEFKASYNLISCASKYGLAFIGTPNGIQVILLPTIVEREQLNKTGEINDYLRREIALPSHPTHLGVSCDQNHLAVVVIKDGCAHALIYSVPSFLSKAVTLVNEIRLSTNPNAHALELQWNPGMPGVIASCMSDGSVGVYEFKTTGVDINTLPPDARATCLCWSPKGKQLVIGTQDGSLTQYKPDLKAVKSFPPPQIFSNPATVINVLWLSNFQFAAIYCDQVDDTERPALVIVNAPKAGPLTYVNYEDICCSCGELRKPQFYLLHQPSWNIIIVGSANSMEVGVLGLSEDQQSWEQWCQEDAARAELPLTVDKQETFPVGIGVDTSSRREIPWGENQTIPPMPVLLLLSHRGVLCIFNAINLCANAPTVCSPPERVPDESGFALFTTVSSLLQPQSQAQSTPLQQPQRKSLSNMSEWNTPIGQNTEASRAGIRVNLSEKFDSLSVPLQQQQQPLPQQSLLQQQQQPQQVLQTPLQSQTAGDSSLFKLPTTSNKPMFSFNMENSSAPGLLATPPVPSSGFSFTNFTMQKPAVNLTSQQPTAPAVAAVPTSLPQQLQSQPPPIAKPQIDISLNALPGTRSNTVQNTTVSELPQKQMPKMGDIIQKPAVTDTVPPSHLKRTRNGNSSEFHAAIVNEMNLFQKELLIQKDQVLKLNVEVGTPEEKVLLRQKVDIMSEFCRELRETTQAQIQEVSALMALQVEVFSWVEDAKSRDLQLNNPRYLQLSQVQELDPMSARCLASIKHLCYYVESQLQQVNETLDMQWVLLEEACKEKIKGKMYIPSMEAVYQSMVTQSNILLKLSADVKTLVEKVALSKKSKLARSAFTQNLSLTRSHIKEKGESNISQLADSLLQMKLGSTNATSIEEVSELVAAGRYSVIVANNKKLSAKKQAKLRELLSEHAVGYVRPNKPANQESQIIIPKETAITSLTNVVENPPGNIFGQIAKSMLIMYGKKPDQTPSELSSKTSMAVVNTEAGSAKISPEVKVGQSDHVDEKISAKPVSNFCMLGTTSKTSASTMFSFTIPSESTHISLFSNDSFKSTMQSPAFSFKPAITATTVTQSVSDTPQFNPKSSTGNLFSQFSSTFTGISSTSTPSVSISSITEEKKGLKASDPEQAGKVVETGGMMKGPSAQMSTSLAKSIFGGTQAKLSPGESSGVEKEETHLTNQDKNPALSGFNLGSLNSAISISPASGTAQNTSGITSMGSIFGGAIKNNSSNNSKGFTFNLQQNGATISPVEPQDSIKSSSNSLNTFSFSLSGAVPTATEVTTTTATFFGQTICSPSSLEQKTSPVPAPASLGLSVTPVTTPSFFGTPSSTLFGSSSASAVPGQNLFSTAASHPPSGSVTTPQPITTSSPSTLFATTAVTTSALSIFGGGAPIAVSSSSSATSSAPLSVVSSVSSASTPTSHSMFGIAPVTTTSMQSTSSTITTTSATTEGVLTTTTPTLSVSTSSAFGTSSTSSSVPTKEVTFDAMTTAAEPAFSTPAVTTQSIFGAAATSATSVFGAATTATTTTTSSLFGTSASNPLFGASNGSGPTLFGNISSGTTSTPGSFFGVQTAKETPSLFGATPTTSTSIFGSATTTTSAPSLFGSAPATTSAPSFFGSTATTTSTPSPFAVSTTTTSAPSFFNSVAATTAPSLFGSAPVTTTSTTPSLFGSSTTSGASSPFGSSGSGGRSGTSLFGTAAPAPSTSLFGSASGGSSSFFGQPTTTTTASSLFGQSPTFGQNTTAGFGNKSVFGQSGSSVFGQNSGSGFGSSGGTVFGSASSFGGGNAFQPAAGGSIFGGGSSQTSPTGGAFSSGSLGQSVSQTGFGSPTSFSAKPGGFGGSPVFGQTGSSPGFGSPPTFGSQPVFGSSPTFGSPGSTFGPSNSQQSSAFGNLASQNTVTFSNIANSGSTGGFGSGQPLFGSSTQTSNQSSFSGAPNFGSSSFTSWR